MVNYRIIDVELLVDNADVELLMLDVKLLKYKPSQIKQKLQNNPSII